MIMWGAAVEYITATEIWDINNTQNNFAKCKPLISYSYYGVKILAGKLQRKFQKENFKNRFAFFLSFC